jgi:hypothetical protein
MRSCTATRRALAAWWNISLPSRDTVHDFEQAGLRTLLGRKDPAVLAPVSGIVQDWMFRDKPPQFLHHIGSDKAKDRIPSFRAHYDRLWGKETFSATIADILDTGYWTVKTEEVEAELQAWVVEDQVKQKREQEEDIAKPNPKGKGEAAGLGTGIGYGCGGAATHSTTGPGAAAPSYEDI